MSKNGRNRPKIDAKLGTSSPEVCAAMAPDEVRGILWGIARDPEQSGTARVSACRLLLIDHRERDGGEADHMADINKRTIQLMKQRAAN